MAVGLGVGFIGYWLAYYGYCSLRGPGVGILDLIVPGRDVTIPTSAGGDQATISKPGQYIPGFGSTGPSGLHPVQTPNGTTFEPNKYNSGLPVGQA